MKVFFYLFKINTFLFFFVRIVFVTEKFGFPYILFQKPFKICLLKLNLKFGCFEFLFFFDLLQVLFVRCSLVFLQN